jgi:hypothetical protein
MKNILEKLAKKQVPTVLGAIAVDSWISGKREAYKNYYMELAIKNGLSREEALVKANALADRAMTHQKNYFSMLLSGFQQ